MGTVRNYLSLVKFSHTIFAMPFAAIGLLLGMKTVNFHVDWEIPVLVLLCMVFARTAAMSFNRWADRRIDAKNPRTAVREIPSGIISENSVLIFTISNVILFIGTTYLINPLCFYLSPVAMLVVLGYSYTKRFTALCHIILGIGLSLAPIGAYLAVTGKFDLLPVLFSLAVICWVSGFDVIYALQDDVFDKLNFLHSMPSSLGRKGALNVSKSLHLIASLILLYAMFYGQFHWVGFTGWLFFTCLLIYQHSLVKADDLKKVNIAFFTTNGIASVVFSIFIITDLLK